jgi:hypothetical protein
VGAFAYEKQLKNGDIVVCKVHVFTLKVRSESKQWPEQRQREVKWLSAKEAAATVREPMLSTIIRRLARADRLTLNAQALPNRASGHRIIARRRQPGCDNDSR